MDKFIEEKVEELRPRVWITYEQEVRWGNAKHILQSALDEWYKDFEPALRTTLQEQREEIILEVRKRLAFEGVLSMSVEKSLEDLTQESNIGIVIDGVEYEPITPVTQESNNDKV